MSLYILSFVLMVLGVVLTSHQQRDSYRDTWGYLLLGVGFLMGLVRFIVDTWRFV
jgi:hypothetical protein